jgi:hypothetical protein
VIKKFYGKLAIRIGTATNVRASHSFDEPNASGVQGREVVRMGPLLRL